MLPFTDDSGNYTVEPHVEQIQKRPFAQLIGQNLSNTQCLILEFICNGFFATLIPIAGSSNPVGENNVVQWEHKGGETFTNHMGYSKGQLLVQMEGHYYLYSKVTLNAAEECSLVQHKVMKVTKAYGQAIELMKSKRLASEPHLPDTFLELSVVSWRLMFPLVLAAPGMQKFQLLNLPPGRICGTASWLEFSTCKQEIKFMSHWKTYRRSTEERLITLWEPL